MVSLVCTSRVFSDVLFFKAQANRVYFIFLSRITSEDRAVVFSAVTPPKWSSPLLWYGNVRWSVFSWSLSVGWGDGIRRSVRTHPGFNFCFKFLFFDLPRIYVALKKAFKPLVCRAGNQEMLSCWRQRRGRIPDCPWYYALLGKMKPETRAKKNFINKFGNLFCLLMLSFLTLNKIYQALLSTWCPRCQGLRDEKNSGTFLQGVWLPGQRESNPGRQCGLET